MSSKRGPRSEKRKIFAGRYAYSRPLGRGAGGAVYLCDDIQNNNRQVAVKVLSAEAFATVQGKMLKREFEILSKLDHPNLVRVYDYGPLPDGGVFLAEEYIDGFSLQDARALIQPEGLIDITMQMLHGLSYLHGMGMIHRDIKPANVMLLWLDDAKARPMVKLVDFGLSSMDPKKDTLRGGTRSYMAPEIIRGEKGELRSDLYSLGVTLYYAMCGVLPFGPRSKSDPPPTEEPFRPPDPHRLNPDVPLNLSRFTMILLRQVEDLDFADAGESLQHLAKDSEALEWVSSGRMAQNIDIAAPPVLRGYFERGIVLREAQNRDNLVDRLLTEIPTGKLYLIRGGPGVGKSRLAREVTAAVKLGGRIVVETSCSGKQSPFSLLVAVLRGLIDVAESRGLKLGERIRPNANMLARLAEWIGHSLSADEKAADYQWIREALEDIAVVLHPDKVVLVIEDMHDADDESVEFLRQWFDSDGAFHRPHVVATVRPGGAPDRLVTCRDTEVIEVQGLQEEDVRYLFETRLGVAGLPDMWMKQVATASKGNPSYVEEISRHFIDSGALTRRSAIQWDVEVDELVRFQLPRGMNESFRRRLTSFGKAGREVLELMALLDRPVEWSVLRKLMMARGEKEEEADRMIELLRWRHFVYLDLNADGRFVRLIAPALRDVVIEQMNSEWKRSLHRRIGARLQKHWIRGETDVDEVAFHMVAGDHESAGAMCEIHGDAVSESDLHAAASAYEAAASIAGGPSKALILTKLAENYLLRSESEEAVKILEEAWSVAERTALDWLMYRVTITGARVTLALGQFESARSWLNRLEDGLPFLGRQSGVLLPKARIAIAEGRLRDAYAGLHTAVAQFEHFGNMGLVSVARAHLATIKRLEGDYEAAARLVQPAVESARDSEAPRALGPALLQAGVLLRHTGQYEDSRDSLNESFEYLSQYGGVDLCAEVLIELGETHLACGDLEKARRRGIEAARLALAFGHRFDEIRAELLVADLDIREVDGVEDALAVMADHVEELASSPYARPSAVAARFRYGRALQKSGKKERGKKVEEKARAAADELGIHLPG